MSMPPIASTTLITPHRSATRTASIGRPVSSRHHRRGRRRCPRRRPLPGQRLGWPDRRLDVQRVEQVLEAAAGDGVVRGARRERRVHEVARQADHRDLAGRDVDLDEEHDVHPPAPAIEAGVGAEQEQVEPAVVAPRHRARPRPRHRGAEGRGACPSRCPSAVGAWPGGLGVPDGPGEPEARSPEALASGSPESVGRGWAVSVSSAGRSRRVGPSRRVARSRRGRRRSVGVEEVVGRCDVTPDDHMRHDDEHDDGRPRSRPRSGGSSPSAGGVEPGRDPPDGQLPR